MDTPRTPFGFPLTARAGVAALRNSKIREVANAGLGRADVLPFWFGEPDEVTPEFIRRAGAEAIQRGETFYTHNFGIPELREALSAYVSRLHGATPPDRIAVTSSGMSALLLVVQALVSPGDRVVVLTPVWPNLVEIPKIHSGEVVTVPLRLHASGWRLDLDALLAALTPDTRLFMINSPNNPTGWTISREEQAAILAHCRRNGTWIVADDAYERLVYEDTGGRAVEDRCAPSFLDLADDGDRVVSTNTFSKSWLMTGWRLGWIVAPPALIQDIGKLIEYNTSCTPVFVQRAGVVAVTQGDAVIARTLMRYRAARDFLVGELSKIRGLEVARPAGAMYVFFRVEGITDSLDYCKKLATEAGLGLAPGIAFGPEGEGFLRWCFAATEENLAKGVSRLLNYRR
jgi:aspartate/methionine/tyrosine aminotransferase